MPRTRDVARKIKNERFGGKWDTGKNPTRDEKYASWCKSMDNINEKIAEYTGHPDEEKKLKRANEIKETLVAEGLRQGWEY